MHTLKPQFFVGEHPGGRELELAGYLEVFIAALQYAVETMLMILEDLGQGGSDDFAARLQNEKYSQAMDAYVTAGEKLAASFQQLLGSSSHAAQCD